MVNSIIKKQTFKKINNHMRTYIKKKLNPFEVDLNGINLIEASAGTGKTFTIIILYLRLLLGLGTKQNHTKKLLVHEILVVTFTNAAKEELYIRIKNSIYILYIACIKKKSNNPFCQLFLKEIKNIEEAINILKIAQNNINHIAIYTIHSFCQKILKSYTIHFNGFFKESIIENENQLYLQATQDFWRCNFYHLPEKIIKIIYQDFKNPDILLQEIKPFLHITSINFEKKIDSHTLITYHEKNIQKINCFKKIWLQYHHNILNILHNLNINKKIYSTCNLVRWMNNINLWSKSPTEDYTIPIVLKYFNRNTIKKHLLNQHYIHHIIFEESQKILKKNFSLKEIILFQAIKTIPKFLKKEKEKKSLVGFHDLLNILLKTIKKENFLKDLIHQQYPAAFIDEFQDTDMQQYKIFNIIYRKNPKTVLFLIGDPKQAIYSFRGADIFSYLYAKSKIKKHYYLDTNWRSSIKMSQSINFLFSQNKNPFLFHHISFLPIKTSSKNIKMDFTIKGVSQIPVTFFFNKKKDILLEEYQNWIAKTCAYEISYWITCAQKGSAVIQTKNRKKILEYSDIAILVKNEKEANIIQRELNKLNIVSTYSSSKRSIFQILDAQELLWILKSILEPTNEKLLQQSYSTHILKRLLFIEKNMLKDKSIYFITEKLYEYNDIWKKKGILYMIQKIILDYQNSFNVEEKNTIEDHKNLNFLHIGELLEEQFRFINKRISLMYWFQKKILEKKQPVHSECIRYLHQSEAIKIITIYKSKGLEYPIIWIPFIIDFKQSKSSIYHDRNNFKIFFDIEKTSNSLKLSDEERLAEDLRLLYVAITRAILHCSIGIASLIKKRIKNDNYNSHLHHSSLGYIIQNGCSMNYENLINRLNHLTKKKLIEIKNTIIKPVLSLHTKKIYLLDEPKFLKNSIKNSWDITSFTQLNKENKFLYNTKNIILPHQKQQLTIHTFPKGKKTGLLMHFILKNINFSHLNDDNWFANVLEQYNIPKKWTFVLMSWIYNILNTPLNNQQLLLSKLKKNLYVKELEFFLPVNKKLCSTEVNKIIQYFDAISSISPKLFFHPVSGILTGVIDLFFCWDNKYYIVDYKSNWLGKDNDFYSDTSIKKEIVKKRYDLQYQIYTIAIHQFLQKKVKNYNYKKHFGGVFYIFLRAINNPKNNGIFHIIPNYYLVNKLLSLTI